MDSYYKSIFQTHLCISLILVDPELTLFKSNTSEIH